MAEIVPSGSDLGDSGASAAGPLQGRLGAADVVSRPPAHGGQRPCAPGDRSDRLSARLAWPLDADDRSAVSEVRLLLIARIGLIGKRLAAKRVALEGAPLVVAKAWLVVGEEHLAHQLPPAANAGLLEDLLQVLLNRVGETTGPRRSGRSSPPGTSRVTSRSRSVSP